jgi:Nif-specific regulatory protein
MLESCYFPGNVRELENCIRHTATLARSKVLADADFPCQNDGCLSALLWKGVRAENASGYVAGGRAPPAPAIAPPPQTALPSPPSHSSDGDKDRLLEAMEKSGWVQAKAARILGVTPRQVGYALRKHRIALRKF